mmetsp:Transcript_34883/g.98915  ORF Transcript_34883/g.98915 Transcript_34883/m.98915 type:complete len:203 (-) Transcript_34883:308-916(-)
MKLKAEKDELAKALEHARQQLRQEEETGAPGARPRRGWLQDAMAAQWNEEEDDLLIIGGGASSPGLQEADGDENCQPGRHAAAGPAGTEKRPTFVVRPDGGQRPPPMQSSLAGSQAFILQGADGRGGRTTVSSTRKAPFLPSSFLNKRQLPHNTPLAAKGNISRSTSSHMIPRPKRPRTNYEKHTAIQDIANYFKGKENSAS